MPKLLRTPLIKSLIKGAFLLLLCVWLVVYTNKHFASIYSQLLNTNIKYLGIAFGLIIFHLATIFLAWSTSLSYLKAFVGTTQLLQAYTLSNLTKYIPGGVWQPSYRTYALHKYGIALNVIVLSLLLEVLMGVFGSLAVGLLTFDIEDYTFLQVPGGYPPKAIGIIAGLMILYALSSNGFYRRVCQNPLIPRKLIMHLEPMTTLPTSRLVRLVGLHVVSLLIYSAAYYFCFLAFSPNLDIAFSTLVSFLMLATFLGLVAVFAPAGLGVREGFLYVLIAPVLGHEIALVAVVTPRLIILLAEFFSYASVELIIQSQRLPVFNQRRG